MKFLKIFLFCILTVCVSCAFADEIFTVKKIEVKGAQRINTNTVLSYLPIKVGDRYNSQDTNNIIETLYKTGFFSNINLSRNEQTLIVTVDERPIINTVNIVGNKDIPKDKLDEALKKLGFVQGEIFSQSILEQVKQAFSEQYFMMGRYNAKITSAVTPLERKRVAVTITVSEGLIAKVMKISIVGNHAFSESTLLEGLPLAKPSTWSFFTNKDQYSKDKLDKASEALRNYYLDRGFINVKIDSTQVTITPDRKHVYIIYRIIEGEKYTFGDFKLVGRLLFPESDLKKLVNIKPGAVFSRQVVLDSTKELTRKFGNKGYAFPQISVAPEINEAKRTVSLTFNIEPGQRYYVRQIQFSGNSTTVNIALRNMFTQFEGGLYAADTVDETMRNLRQLPYLKPDEINIRPVPVPGKNNQVDLDVHVAEQLSAQFQFSVGYSQAFGLLLNTGITQNNFMGTGKTLGFNFSRSAFQSTYSINYFNPFFTYDGVSRSQQLFYTDTNPAAVRGANFSTSAIGFNDSFGFPISNYQRFNLGYGLQYTHLYTATTPSREIANFVGRFGTIFHQALITSGWDYNTLDQFQFPTRGVRQNIAASISLPVNKRDLQYYMATYQNRFFQPIYKGFILTTYGIAGYGGGYGRYPGLPFLQNYLAGGIGTQGQNRGFLPNTLGPRDSVGNPLGGNVLLSANVGLIVPTPLERYKMRTTTFLDAGNVFNTQKTAWQPHAPVALDNVRYSYGLQIEWWTPLGMPLVFSFSRAIHPELGDQLGFFQFNIGGQF